MIQIYVCPLWGLQITKLNSTISEAHFSFRLNICCEEDEL